MVAGLVTLAVYSTEFYFVREIYGLHGGTRLLALPLVIPAIIPGIVIAMIFQRIPKVVSLRCGGCGWTGKFRQGKTVRRPSTAFSDSSQIEDRTNPRREVPTPTAVEPVPTGVAEIVDDQRDVEELKAWIYAELVTGRNAEEITAELVGHGWPADDVETLVEAGRKETRHRRA